MQPKRVIVITCYSADGSSTFFYRTPARLHQTDPIRFHNEVDSLISDFEKVFLNGYYGTVMIDDGVLNIRAYAAVQAHVAVYTEGGYEKETREAFEASVSDEP